VRNAADALSDDRTNKTNITTSTKPTVDDKLRVALAVLVHALDGVNASDLESTVLVRTGMETVLDMARWPASGLVRPSADMVRNTLFVSNNDKSHVSTLVDIRFPGLSLSVGKYNAVIIPNEPDSLPDAKTVSNLGAILPLLVAVPGTIHRIAEEIPKILVLAREIVQANTSSDTLNRALTGVVNAVLIHADRKEAVDSLAKEQAADTNHFADVLKSLTSLVDRCTDAVDGSDIVTVSAPPACVLAMLRAYTIRLGDPATALDLGAAVPGDIVRISAQNANGADGDPGNLSGIMDSMASGWTLPYNRDVVSWDVDTTENILQDTALFHHMMLANNTELPERAAQVFACRNGLAAPNAECDKSCIWEDDSRSYSSNVLLQGVDVVKNDEDSLWMYVPKGSTDAAPTEIAEKLRKEKFDAENNQYTNARKKLLDESDDEWD
jgi:hypothetical protein